MEFSKILDGCYSSLVSSFSWDMLLAIVLGVLVVLLIVICVLRFRKHKDEPILLMFISCILVGILLLIHVNPNSFHQEIAKDMASSYVLKPYIEASILLLAAFLTFIAFLAQYQFNVRQKDDLDNERKENNIFHFIDNLNQISNEFQIHNVGSHKRAFHFTFYEIKALYHIFHSYFKETLPDNPELCEKLCRVENLVPMCVSFILSGVTSTSNKQIKKRISILFNDDKDVQEYIESDSVFGSLENIVCYFQEISNEELLVLKKEERLILFIDYAGAQIRKASPDAKLPWFGGHRPDLVRYMKYLNMVVQYIEKAYEKDKIKQQEFYNAIFSMMSEHEVGVVYAISQSPQEFGHLLGIKESKDAKGTKKSSLYGSHCSDSCFRLREIVSQWMQCTNEMYNFKTDLDEFNWLPEDAMQKPVLDIITKAAGKASQC